MARPSRVDCKTKHYCVLAHPRESRGRPQAERVSPSEGRKGGELFQADLPPFSKKPLPLPPASCLQALASPRVAACASGRLLALLKLLLLGLLLAARPGPRPSTPPRVWGAALYEVRS